MCRRAMQFRQGTAGTRLVVTRIIILHHTKWKVDFTLFINIRKQNIP